MAATSASGRGSGGPRVKTIPKPDRTTLTLLRPYVPLVAFAVACLVMAVAVSPLERRRSAAAGSIDVPLAVGGSGGSGLSPEAGATDTTLATDGTGGPAGGGGGAPGQAGQPGAQGGGGGQSAPRGAVQACRDRTLQVPGDPYSPPCLTFEGDNGGATATGVTAQEIVVTVRQLEGPTAGEIFADISGESVEDSPESYVNTLQALGEYFSTRFQFYGRKLRFDIFRGQGNGSAELLGGGKEAALADAVTARQKGAFADLSAITTPYADAIARQKIVGFGAPYPSANWFIERRPYAWSLFPDGTLVAEAGVSNTVARLSGQNTAEYAGESLRGRPRVYGLIAPENAEYKESVDRYVQKTGEAGFSFKVNLRYKLDINSMPNQASNIVAQMKDAGVTTLVCACDPVMLALGLAPKANEQDWEPEWLTSGLAFVEQDIVSQLIDERQWQHAFGIAYNAESEPQGGSFPYAAFKQVRPNDEPAFGVEEMYYSMYMLALGVHLAGPNLTPESFEAGMFSYPGRSGPRGFWSFGPTDFTPVDDYREIWWDPKRISPQNNKPGAWVQLNGGARYTPKTQPKGPAPFFQGG